MMAQTSEQWYVEQCTHQIEQRLEWGASADWTNLDFEKLSDAIHLKTDIVLSITTLKRVWGRLKYNSRPSQTTLNALAAFLDFEDWRGFQKSQPTPSIIANSTKTERTSDEELLVNSKKRLLPLLALGITLIIMIAAFIPKGSTPLSSNPYQFEANKVTTEGVPNSVIFSYDASAATTDSVFIVQTWDISRKTLVPRTGRSHSAIYYWPGFFRSKLIVGDRIVKTHDLQITSDGWLALSENINIPTYFEKADYQFSDRIEVTKDLLAANNIELLPTSPRIRFFNQGDYGDLMNDNFIFQTTLRSTHYTGDNACQYVEVLIQCKDDVMIFPLCAKTCVGQAYMYASGYQLNSKLGDLSGFGAEMSEWTTLRVESVDQQVRIYVNGALSTDFVFPNDPTGIVGVQYRFYGSGGINEAWFEHEEDRWDLFGEESVITADY